MKNNIVRLLLLWWAVLPVISWAQGDSWSSGRMVTLHQQLGFGSVSVLDTYLTPEKFSGTALTALSIRETSRQGSRWSTVMQNQLHLSKSEDRAGNDSELEACYNLFWGRYYGWQLLSGCLQVQAGGLLNLGVGGIYNTRNNANNPAQARLSLLFMPSAIATWRLPVWQQRLSLRYEIDLPLAGCLFSPNYGQSYYEIFVLGNYDHNLVPVSFLSAPTFRQQLTVMCNVSQKLTLSLGYLGDYQQSKVNNLKQHVRSHSVMVGLVRRFQLIHYRP